MKEMRIQESITQMMDDFISNSSGLLALSNNTKDVILHKEGDKTVYYGKLFAKPTKRFARLLTADREVLVIFSNFSEQQVRTINKVREIIDSSEGRLEATVSIVVHCDNHANLKLKNWGRQKGISILPLFYEGAFPKEDALEKLLCGELFSHDPFDVSGPVSDDSQFYGRRSEALDMARKLNAGQIRSCLGIRKIGKTSILNRVINDAKYHYGTKCIVVDCSKDQIWTMNAAQLMDAIEISIKNVINHNIGYSSAVEFSDCNDLINISSKRLLESIQNCNDTVVVFFDEVDYITPGSPTGKHWINEFNIFWRNLRAVYQETCRQNNNLGIFVSGVSSKWFNVESIEGIENAALSLIPEDYLSPMPRGATEQMIKILARTSGLQFEGAESIVSDFCSDIPFWIRKSCSYIHKNIDISIRPFKMDEATVQELLSEFLESEGGVIARVALMHLFKVYPELQEVVLKCYAGEGDKCSKVYLNRLERYGIVLTKPSPRISGAMMTEGVKLFTEYLTEINIDTAEPVVAVQNLKIAFDTFDDWADELALLNKRRNIMEKNMRFIVVNFIRVDYYINKGKGVVTDRILKSIPSEQRDRFRNLSPEQIVERFNWTELVRVIEKEWGVFEKMFSDKNAFQLKALAINDRFDAHAKDADHLDVAACRAAIGWIEEKIRMSS